MPNSAIIPNALKADMMKEYKKMIDKLNKPILKIDKLAVCVNDPNSENVTDSIKSLRQQNITKMPGLKLKPGRLYEVEARVTLPLYSDDTTSPVVYCQVGAKSENRPSYRFEFNPSRFDDDHLNHLYGFLNGHFDPTPEEMFGAGKITRIDFALDVPDMTAADVIIRSAGKKKIGLYSNTKGEPQTVYLGAPTGRNRLVAYTKFDKVSGETFLRFEWRVKPNCSGSELMLLSNPFQNIEIYPVAALSSKFLGFSNEIFADSCRVRGLQRTLKLLPPKLQAMAEYKLNAGAAQFPDLTEEWFTLPKKLMQTGLFPDLLPKTQINAEL